MRTTKTITLLAALAFIQLFFVQCSTKNNETATAGETKVAVENIVTDATTAATPMCNIKIAYVDYDSLLLKYNFAQEVQKEIIRKEMSINNIMEKERKSLQEEAATFEHKVQNNVFATQERAQAEYEKIMKKDQELLQRGQAMIAELEKESLAKSAEVNQNIINYIQEFNKEAKYDFILTKMGGNMLYSNEALDITNKVVEGLNAIHSSKEAK